MSKSSLVDYTLLSHNNSGKRTHKIDRITPHCFVGQVTAERGAEVFASASRKASCQYVIAKDGRVALVCDEDNRSWCTSSNSNDQRAITIECASDSKHPYAFTDACYNKLIGLTVDICKRYGKTKLVWINNKEQALAYQPKDNELQITVHRWFANKSCPGDWLMSRMDDYVNKVNSKLTSEVKPVAPIDKRYYRVRLSWADGKSQIGAYTNLDNAKKVCKTGYSVYDWNGNEVYSNKPNNTTVNHSCSPYKVKVTASALNYRKGPGVSYGINGTITDRGIYTIVEEKNGWGKLKSGAGWINLKYTSRV